MKKVPRQARRLRLALLTASLVLGGCSIERWDARHDVSGAPKSPVSYDSSQFQGYDRPPRLIEGQAPVYPFSASQANRPGFAKVSFTVGEDGRARDIKIIEASEPYFGGHTAYAIKSWRFEPARKNGQPVAVRIVQKYSFTPSNGAGQDDKVSAETEKD